MKRNGEDYRRYRALAEQDLQWHKMLWRRDCLPGGLEESCEYLNTAVESAGKALHCPENTLLYFPAGEITPFFRHGFPESFAEPAVDSSGSPDYIANEST